MAGWVVHYTHQKNTGGQHMIHQAERMAEVRSDIRGPLYEEALRMQREGIQVL